MKKVSLSVAARAFVSGRIVWFSTGEGVQALPGKVWSVRRARKLLMHDRYVFASENYFLLPQ